MKEYKERGRRGKRKMSQANRKAPVKTGGTTDEPSREPGAAQRGWDTRQQWGEGKTKLKAEARARLSRAHAPC